MVAWQKPFTEQSPPMGQSLASADHAQPDWAVQAVGLVLVEQPSASTQAPEGQVVLAGHAVPSAVQRQPVVPEHAAWSVFFAQALEATSAATLPYLDGSDVEPPQPAKSHTTAPTRTKRSVMTISLLCDKASTSCRAQVYRRAEGGSSPWRSGAVRRSLASSPRSP